MTTLEKIRAQIMKEYGNNANAMDWSYRAGLAKALDIINEYAEQEPTIRPSFSYTAEIKADDEQLERLQGILNGEMVLRLEQEPCDDVVSRQAVLEQTHNWSKDEFLRVTNPFDYLRKRIKSLPSVRPQEQKTGHWILDETDNSITCDKCGCLIWANDISNGEAYFCPNCGARMERSDKE